MSWQDSFQPLNAAPPSEGWQSSFQPLNAKPYNVNDYEKDVGQAFKGGVQNLKDLANPQTYIDFVNQFGNPSGEYSQKLQGDIVQGNYGTAIKDAFGRMNEAAMQSPSGKLLGGVFGTLTSPAAPAINAGVNKLDEMGLPKEVTQFALNNSPLLLKGARVEGAPETEPMELVNPAYMTAADQLVNKQGLTPESVMQAATKIKNTPDNVPLTLPEYLQNTDLLARQRSYGEQANEAGTSFQNFNNQRLGETLPAVKESLVGQAGDGQSSTLTDAGTQLQSVAKGIIDQAVKDRTAAVKPIYESIKNEPLDNDSMMALRSNPLIENEYQKVLGNDALMERVNQFKPQIPPELQGLSPEAQQQAIAQLPKQPPLVKSTTGGLDPASIGAWDAVKKNLAAQIDTIEAQGRTQEKLYPLLNNARNQVRQILGETNPKYNIASDEYASQSPEISEMQKGPLGILARAQNGENAAKAFMNMSREQLQKVAPQIQKSNPEALNSIASGMLREITDKTSGGGIAPYLKALGGNKLIQDKMQAILSPEAYEGQQALVETLKKVQAGLPRNSETVSKALLEKQTQEEASHMGLLEKAKNVPTSKGELINKGMQIANKYASKFSQQYKADMMKLFIDPDLNELGRALAQVSNPSSRAATVFQWLGNKSLSTGRAISPALQGAANDQNTPFNTSIADAFKKAGVSQQSQPKPQSNASDFFKKEANAESNNNPTAKNPHSSASGTFQFTDGTWKQMVKRYGADTGISVSDKNDPKAQEVMAKLYAKDNINRMQPFLQRLPTKGELYQAHVLGADGALRLIDAANNTPDKQSMMMFPKAVTTANRSLFFDKSGKPLTAAQTYTLLSQKVI
jgi:hypothetical protein